MTAGLGEAGRRQKAIEYFEHSSDHDGRDDANGNESSALSQ